MQLADLQCAFRAQAGDNPLQGWCKPPAKPVVLTVYITFEMDMLFLCGRVCLQIIMQVIETDYMLLNRIDSEVGW